MPISFHCPKCGVGLTVPDTYAGREGICKGCRGRVVAPTAAPPQVSAREDAADADATAVTRAKEPEETARATEGTAKSIGRQSLSEVVWEEHDLTDALVLGALREKDQESMPDVAGAADKSDVEWYTRESSAKKCKQIIIAERNVSLCKSPIGGPFICALQRVRAWGMGTFYSGNVPYLCIKCVGVEQAIKTIPSRLAFSFYRHAEAGLFQPLLEIPQDKNKPFVVENPWNLGGADILRVGRDLLSRPYFILQFFDSSMLGVHARVITPPEDCVKSIRALLDEACKYNDAIPSADFRAAENRYYDMNPTNESPILKK